MATPQPSLSDRSKGTALKRYNLVIPEALFNEIQQIADTEHTTVADLIRRFIKLGLLAAKLEEEEDASLIIREGSREREILFFT